MSDGRLDLDDIEARAAGATDRPYSHLSGSTAAQRSANATFITAARDDVLTLIAEVRRLRDESAEVYKVHDHLIGRAEAEARRACTAEAEVRRLRARLSLYQRDDAGCDLSPLDRPDSGLQT